MTIYTTPFHPGPPAPVATAESADSGIDSFGTVRLMMGEPLRELCGGRVLIYEAGDGQRNAHSDFPFNAPRVPDDERAAVVGTSAGRW